MTPRVDKIGSLREGKPSEHALHYGKIRLQMMINNGSIQAYRIGLTGEYRMKMYISTLCGTALAGLVAVGFASQAQANPSNLPPPSGWILDLAGTPITNDQQSYSVNFTAALASTDITFAFRQDPSFESFSNVQLVDLTNPGGNIILNGDFSQGTLGTSNVADWTYANVYGATYGGVLEAGCGVNGSNCWYDGAVQAYDAIDQYVSTNIGDVYQLSFNLNGGGANTPNGLYQQLSTNGNVTGTGGDGIDVLAYAQGGLPPPGTVPEASTWVMMILGFAGLGFAGYRTTKGRAAIVA